MLIALPLLFQIPINLKIDRKENPQDRIGLEGVLVTTILGNTVNALVIRMMRKNIGVIRGKIPGHFAQNFIALFAGTGVLVSSVLAIGYDLWTRYKASKNQTSQQN